MRFSVQKKLIIIGACFSFVVIIASFLTSFFIYKNHSEKNFIKSIDNSIAELEYTIGNKSSLESLAEYVNAWQSVYEQHKDDVIPNFQTPAEEYEYYRDIYSNIYPAKNQTFGLDAMKLKLETIYTDISSDLATAAISSGGNSAYLGVFVPTKDLDTGKFIYLIDSNFRFTDYKNKEYDGKGNLPGSEYILTASDLNLDPHKSYGGFSMNGKNARIISFDLDENSDLSVTAFLEYDASYLQKDIGFFILVETIILVVILVLLIAGYILLARFAIVKNIVKLTNSANEFTNSIKQGNVNEVINPDIKSRDEIGVLSSSFMEMENEIIDYTKKIELATIEKEKINAELSVATKIQLESLPKNVLNDENVLINASIKSAKEVGGDFYDYFYIDDIHLAIIISDVSGKGIPAALFMMKAKELLKSKLLLNMKIEDACYQVNNELIRNNTEGLFITAFIGKLNVLTHELELVNAGHEKPYIISENKVIKYETNSNFILGGIEDYKYEKDIIKLSPNDKFFLHTDGLNESINEKREEFGYDRIISGLDKYKNNRLIEILDGMTKELNSFTKNNEAFDDVTMMILEIKPQHLSFNYKNPDYQIIDEITNKMNDYFSFVDKTILSKMGIIIDEVLNNYISYEKKEELIINVNFELKNDDLIIIFSNNGDEFNPLLKEKKYIENDTDLTPGGLGITIITELADDVKYERKDNYNYLIVNKTINSAN